MINTISFALPIQTYPLDWLNDGLFFFLMYDDFN